MNRKERKLAQKNRKAEIKELQKTYFNPISETERQNILMLIENNGATKLMEEKFNTEVERLKATVILGEWLYEEGLIGLGHLLNRVTEYNLVSD